MLRRFAFLLYLIISTQLVTGQRVINGAITDFDRGEGLEGATIYVGDLGIGTTADYNGDFVLELPVDFTGTVSISYLGYATQLIDVTKTTNTMNVRLKQDAFQLTDLLVTASKRKQQSQLVPLSIYTLPFNAFKTSGLIETADHLSMLPNITFTSTGGGGNVGFGDGRYAGRTVAIRGVSGDRAGAIYLDETPLPEFANPRLFDIDRIEALQGPQGTLYGSSTMGGAVRVLTRKPNLQKKGGGVTAFLGKTKEGGLDHSIQIIQNLPLANKKSGFRIGGFYNYRSGTFDRQRQTHFNGFPMNTDDGQHFKPDGGIWDHDENPQTPSIKWDDKSLPVKLAGTPNTSPWADQEVYKKNIDTEKSLGIHASYLFKPSKQFSILPKIIYEDTRANGYDFADFYAGNFDQYRVAGLNEKYGQKLLHTDVNVSIGTKRGEFTNSISYSIVDQLDVEDLTERQNAGLSNNEIPGFFPNGDFRSNQEVLFYPAQVERTGHYSRLVEEVRYSFSTHPRLKILTGLFFSQEQISYQAFQEREMYLAGLSGYIKNIIRFSGLPETTLDRLQEQIDFIDKKANGTWFSLNSMQKTTELAFFGDVDWEIIPKINFLAGIRHFTMQQQYDHTLGGYITNGLQTSNAQAKGSGLMPRFTLTWSPTPTSKHFLSAAKGYRLGGANPTIPIIYAQKDLEKIGLQQVPVSYEEDAIWTYEAGTKNTFANGKLLANLIFFYSYWENMQQKITLPSGYFFIDNIGLATIKGFDFQARLKLMNILEINQSAGVAKGRISKASLATGAEEGDWLLNVPQFTASSGIVLTQKMNKNTRLIFRVDMQHTGKRLNTFTPETETSFIFQPFTILNASVSVNKELVQYNLLLRNITNTKANLGNINSLESNAYMRYRYQTNRPFSIGLSVSYFPFR